MKTLNIIGAGRVGKTLGYIFSKSKLFSVGQILNRTFSSSKQAQEFIGHGTLVENFSQLQPADVVMLTVTDEQLPKVVEQLVNSNSVTSGTIVFHCSGALSSCILKPLREHGALIASVHPMKSFSEPLKDIQAFAKIYCSIDGDELATEILKNYFEHIGAVVKDISVEDKLLYHTANIFSNNYIVTLIETSLNLLSAIGIEKSEGLQMLQPLIEGACHQTLTKGTEHALTGPIARGDSAVIYEELQALQTHQDEVANAYRILGKLTLQLATKKKQLTLEQLQTLENILK